MTPQLWMKFGGAALADGEGVRRACGLVASRLAERPAVVVSAHAGVTRLLRAAAEDAARGGLEGDHLRLKHKALLRQLELDPELLDAHLRELAGVLGAVRSSARLGKAELDYVLSFGERMSARVVAAALRRTGVQATPVDAFDLGLVSDSAHGRARPLPGYAASVRQAIDSLEGVPVVTGFLARDHRGALTTLGRNGSDLTAALLAEATGARELCFWKSVPGVMSADPHEVPEARSLESIRFEDARILALSGADVLHPEALAPARRSGAQVRVCDVRSPEAPGTRIQGEGSAGLPVALASEPELVRLDLESRGDGRLSKRLAEILSLLDQLGLEPRSLSGGSAGSSLCVLPLPTQEPATEELLQLVQPSPRLASITLVGASSPALLQSALELLDRAGLPPIAAQADPARPCLSFLCSPEVRLDSLRALHAGFLSRTGATAR
jgi:aspartate kinase